MSCRVSLSPFLIFALCCALSACADFPELEVSEAEFDSDTPYPEFVPLEVLLKEPEVTITDETQAELDTRREDLQSTPVATPDAEDDALQERIDALRKRQKELSENTATAETDANVGDDASDTQSIEDRLRDRLENGIRPPTSSEWVQVNC